MALLTIPVHISPPLIRRLQLLKASSPTATAKRSTRASTTPPSLPMDPTQMSRARELVAEFPHLLAPHRDILATLVSSVDARLASHLLPSSASVPPDVELYQNDAASSHGCLSINRGLDSSPIDFILTSCLHLTLPNGASMNVATLQGFLKPLTDAPHFVFEVTQSSPTNFVFYLDLTSRKDLVLHPDYLKAFYEDSQVEACRKKLYAQVPEVQPYIPPSLYLRCLLSPTGILAHIKCDDAGPERVEEILRDHITSVADEVLGIWMDNCVCTGGRVGEKEIGELEGRDRMIKIKAVELDLSPTLPMVFGQEVGDRVLRVIRNAFRIG